MSVRSSHLLTQERLGAPGRPEVSPSTSTAQPNDQSSCAPTTGHNTDDMQAKCRTRSEALHRQLLVDCTPEAADEALLAKMTADASATLSLIDEAQVLAVIAIHRHIDDPRAFSQLTAATQRLMAIGNGLSHRVGLSLGAAASLRLQRRLLRLKKALGDDV